MLTAKARWAWWGVMTLLVLVLATAGGTMYYMNKGPLPDVVTRTIVSQVEKVAPVTVAIDEARFVGPTELRLSGVTALVAQGKSSTLEFSQPVRIRQVNLRFDPLAILRGEWAQALLRVELVEPQVHLAQTRPVSSQEAAITMAKEKQGGSGKQEGAEARQGSPAKWPELAVRVRQGRLVMADAGVDSADTIVVRDINAGLVALDKGWRLEHLQATGMSNGRIKAEGSLIGLDMSIDLTGEGLSLPQDLPWVKAWGISGTGDFSGEVKGSLSQPQLRGEAIISAGTLWQQPISRAEGNIRVDAASFSFDQVKVESGKARYELAGSVWGWDEEQGQLDISLNSKQGRIEELLGVLGVAFPAHGQLDGSLRFNGPFDNVITSGEVVVADSQVWGEQFDWAQGAFRWGDGMLQLDSIEARLEAGHLALDGAVKLDGSEVQVDLESTHWPLGQVTHLDQFIPEIEGKMSATGSVSGSVADPNFSGQVLLSDLRAGQVHLTKVEGPLTLQGATLHSEGMIVSPSNGGKWLLTGGIIDVLSAPVLNLGLQVEDQAMSSLLAMGGIRLPLNLVDGKVHGQVSVTGDLTNPTANLELYLAGEMAGAGDAFRLEMEVVEKRVRIIHFG